MLNKRQPKKKLTPLQQNRLLKVFLILVSLALLWVLLSPTTGVYGLLKLRREAARLEQQTKALQQSNEELRQEIDRLQNDPEYLERVAREKYGMLKKNEQVFDFSGAGNEQAESAD